MFESQGKWKKIEILKVVYMFISTHDVNGEIFFNVEDSNGGRKKQIWLLLPILFQCHKLVEYLEESSKMSFNGAFAYVFFIEFIKKYLNIIKFIFATMIICIIIFLGKDDFLTLVGIPFLFGVLEVLFVHRKDKKYEK